MAHAPLGSRKEAGRPGAGGPGHHAGVAARKTSGPGTTAARADSKALPVFLRADFERRYGADFSGVRVHDGADAAEAAATLGARAYTLGRDIVFGAGEYAPGNRVGRQLIAHELAHVVQQQRTAPTARPEIAPSDGNAERAADLASALALAPGGPAFPLGEMLGATGPGHPSVQRAAKTWAGTFDTVTYEELTAFQGQDGVHIDIRFTPGPRVDATRIAMVQTARSMNAGAPVPPEIDGTGPRAGTLNARTLPADGPAGGTRIDRRTDQRSPLYGTMSPPDATGLSEGSGTIAAEHGYRYRDATGQVRSAPAHLRDQPALPYTMRRSSQVFETTAMGVEGAQAGVYYGSVEWGWWKDGNQNVRLLPFTKRSDYMPSAAFLAAAALWNRGNTSTGADTLDLPLGAVVRISRPGVALHATAQDAVVDGGEATPLPKGTRVRVLDRTDPTAWRVEVADGPDARRVGYIAGWDSTADDPVEDARPASLTH